MQTEIIHGIFILLSGQIILKETYLSKDAKHSLGLYIIVHMFRNFDLTMLQSWWHHDMEILSSLLALCEGNPLVTGKFPSQE